jgi:hypothetical protein
VVYDDISDAQDEALSYELADNGNVVLRPPRQAPPSNSIHTTNAIKSAIIENTILIHSIYVIAKQAVRVGVIGEKRSEVSDLLKLERHLWTVDQRIFEDWGNEGLKSMTIYMDKLLALLRKNNIKLTVAVYPHPQQIIRNDLESIQVTHWKSWSKENDVGFINYFPMFFENGKHSEEIIRSYFIKGDVHWNEAGHRLIAEEFLAYRRQQQSH